MVTIALLERVHNNQMELPCLKHQTVLCLPGGKSRNGCSVVTFSDTAGQVEVSEEAYKNVVTLLDQHPHVSPFWHAACQASMQQSLTIVLMKLYLSSCQLCHVPCTVGSILGMGHVLPPKMCQDTLIDCFGEQGRWKKKETGLKMFEMVPTEPILFSFAVDSSLQGFGSSVLRTFCPWDWGWGSPHPAIMWETAIDFCCCHVDRLQEADLGFVLVVDRRQDKWAAVKTMLLRISVRTGRRN